MNKRKQRNRFLRRGLAFSAAVGLAAVVAVLPLDWGRAGRAAALMAVSLRQPAAATSLLGERLFPPMADTDTPPVVVPENREDTTIVDVPAVVPPATAPAITMISPPGNKGDGGPIVERKMDVGDTFSYGIATLNRSGTAVDIAAALQRDLPFGWADTDAPQVLILHTHTTEGFMTYDAGYYNAGDRDRTTDHTRSVCAVGEAVKLELAAAGIAAIHDTTVHDSPVYSGAYTRSAATARSYLEQYPTIRVVLDLHRDAVMEGDAPVKPTVTVAGQKAAQMMLITGVVSTTELPHPHWQDNLTFATRLQQALGQVSPDLMRPLNTVASRYNQHLSPGWVLVEVGSEGNTVAEAVYSGQILGRTLAALLD